MTRHALVLVVALLVCGCQSRTVIVPTGRTSAPWRIPVYATDNVPFEYEEIGFVSVIEHGSAQEKALSRFQKAVDQLGADAVLGFRLEYEIEVGGFWLVLSDTSYVKVTGVAVKIKRP